MLSFFENGHGASCPAPRSFGSRCTCEPTLYVFVGILAILAGALQTFFGIWSSLSLISDAFHALSDGAADLIAAIIAVGILRNPHKEKSLRDNGRKVIALLLAIGAAWVLYEAAERTIVGGHVVVPWVLAAGGVVGANIDALRLSLLKKAQGAAPNETRPGLIAHARGDLYRSIIAAGIGGALVVGEHAITAQWFVSTMSYTDLALSSALSVYMFFLAKKIWHGEHAHAHNTHDHKH